MAWRDNVPPVIAVLISKNGDVVGEKQLEGGSRSVIFPVMTWDEGTKKSRIETIEYRIGARLDRCTYEYVEVD